VVERELDALEERATAAGAQQPFYDALDRIYEILRIYPQYGEVLRELTVAGASALTSRAFAIAPLFIEYILDEPNRRVIIATPLRALPRSGFE
jgi:hypothetical protein